LVDKIGLSESDDDTAPRQTTDTSLFSRADTAADNETNTTTEDDTEDEYVHPCDRPNFGYPDYEGTNKEGETCADAPLGERTAECLANPPTSYDGLIQLSTQSSDPEMLCCFSDGKCHWGDE